MTYKKFTIPVDNDPKVFDLGDERYHARPQIAAGILINIVAPITSGTGEMQFSIGVVHDLMSAALKPDDYERFTRQISDPEIAVPLELVIEIAMWLAEEYAGGRPTGESLSNTSDNLSTGGGSTAGASVETPIYSRSPQTEHSI